jgi:O-antigen/teichoic acid export membrane protein
MTRRRVPTLAHETSWSLLNEGAALIAATMSFTLLGLKLGPDTYGAFLAVSAVIAPLSAFASSGVFLTILDHLKRGRGPAIDVVRSCLGLAVIIGTAGSVVAVTVVALFVHAIDVATAVLLCAGELVFGSLSSSLLGVIQVEKGFVRVVKTRICYHASRIVMLVTLWQTGNVRLLPYSIAQTGMLVAYCVVTSGIVRRHFQRLRLVGRVRWHDFRSIMTYASGLSAIGVQNDGDKFALNRSGFGADAGRYGFAYRIVQIGLLPVTALLSVTHVSFLDPATNIKPAERAIRLAKLATVYVAFITIVMWFAAPLVPRVLGDDYANTGDIIRWLLPLIFLRGIGTFAMNGLLGLDRNGLRTRLLIGNAAFSVILYAVLIPAHSWRGAAIATDISEVSLFVCAWTALFVCQRQNLAGRQISHIETDLVTDEIEQDELR